MEMNEVVRLTMKFDDQIKQNQDSIVRFTFSH